MKTLKKYSFLLLALLFIFCGCGNKNQDLNQDITAVSADTLETNDTVSEDVDLNAEDDSQISDLDDDADDEESLSDNDVSPETENETDLAASDEAVNTNNESAANAVSENATINAEPTEPAVETTPELVSAAPVIDENGSYTSKDDVALYLHTYGKLPSNFITKNQAKDLGWEGGSLEPYATGKCIGGDYFGNYEGILPDGNYHECDIDTLGKDSRGAKRLVFDDNGNIYYTEDHYASFVKLY